MTSEVEKTYEFGTDAFVITRVFDAPCNLVFNAWAKPEHLAQWWGPKGFRIFVNKLEFRPGGLFHYGMEAPNGAILWGRFVYLEIVEPERIVFINSFSDEAGGITRAPFDGTWPLEMLNAITLTEQDGKTTLTLRGGPLNATDEERATYKAGHASMQQGFGGTFDQLEAYLAGVS